MADEKASRFIILDGVQYSRERAARLGLIKATEEPQKSPLDGPPSSRARASASARKGAPVAPEEVSE